MVKQVKTTVPGIQSIISTLAKLYYSKPKPNSCAMLMVTTPQIDKKDLSSEQKGIQ